VKEKIKAALQIGVITGTVLLVTLFFLIGLEKKEYISGVVFGYLVSLVNVLFAYLSITWAFKKSSKTFFATVLGGMGVRFVILGSALFFVYKFAQIPMLGFTLSLIGFYLTLQFFEIRFIQRELDNRKALKLG